MSDETRGLRQPLRGAAAFIITVGISLAFCALFTPATLGTWVALLFTNAVPALIILDLGLHLQWPSLLRRSSLPVRGLVLAGLSALSSAIVSPIMLRVVGGGATPPNPFVVMFSVLTVPVALVLVILFACWPVARLSRKKGVVGVGTLILTYLLAWLVFRLFYDFGFLHGAPAYLDDLDPGGLFSAWQATAFLVTYAAVMLCLVLFAFWPLSALIPKRRSLGEQPFFGLLTGALTVLITLVVWGVPTGLLGIDPIAYMVRGPVALIFGVFIVLSIFQEAGFTRLKQPLKGAAMTAAAVILAVAVQVLYGAVAKLIAPGIASGAPTHELELWISTAMLGVTFPVIVVFCGALGFWPLVPARSGDRDQATPRTASQTPA